MELIVDGHYISTLTAWGDLDWSLAWPGYSDELTFDASSHPSIFKPGKVVSLVWAGQPLWSGTLDEPVRGQKLRAAGMHRLADRYPSLDSVGNLTTVPNTGIDAAIANMGLPWTRPDNVASGPAPLNADAPSTLTAVLTAAFADNTTGIDWGVLPTNQALRFTRPAPRLHIRPGGDGLGIAWDNYASTLVARYVDSTTHVYTTVTRTDATAAARWGAVPATIRTALNGGAEMTLATAQGLLDGMLAKGRSRPGWTTPIEVQHGAVLNDHQQPIDLATIRPWEVIRVHGLTEDVGDLAGQSYVDMPLARIQHNPKAGTATLTPVGLVSPMNDVLSGKKP